jgi:hypothetical protein
MQLQSHSARAWNYLVGTVQVPWLALAVLGVGAVVVLTALTARRRRRSQRILGPWPLEVREQLLTEREQVLFQRLRQALPDHLILAQVQLLQVLEFLPGGRTQALVNRISQLSIDFLVLNADTSVVAAVELDDASHRRRDRPWADARKTHALKCAGVPLVRWNARNLPDGAAIRVALLGDRSARRA